MSLFDSLTPAPPSSCVHGRNLSQWCPFCSPLPPAQKDSITSVKAAHEIAGAALVLREQVFACIVVNGPVTDEAIAELTEMNPSTARPRRVELQRAGRIEADGTRMTKSGRQAQAWVVVQ